ncbi:unnamed protein product [Nesidiocoris tenuis]|uniref:Uncharacterized protein n=1 Tax=Nesidiocoris tenuis TaxID=355587 RepID=A0A6H5G377_9HEMI|nr:unnamed protein product [Nesidiocoris tenuis]
MFSHPRPPQNRSGTTTSTNYVRSVNWFMQFGRYHDRQIRSSIRQCQKCRPKPENAIVAEIHIQNFPVLPWELGAVLPRIRRSKSLPETNFLIQGIGKKKLLSKCLRRSIGPESLTEQVSVCPSTVKTGQNPTEKILCAVAVRIFETQIEGIGVACSAKVYELVHKFRRSSHRQYKTNNEHHNHDNHLLSTTVIASLQHHRFDCNCEPKMLLIIGSPESSRFNLHILESHKQKGMKSAKKHGQTHQPQPEQGLSPHRTNQHSDNYLVVKFHTPKIGSNLFSERLHHPRGEKLTFPRPFPADSTDFRRGFLTWRFVIQKRIQLGRAHRCDVLVAKSLEVNFMHGDFCASYFPTKHSIQLYDQYNKSVPDGKCRRPVKLSTDRLDIIFPCTDGRYLETIALQ